MGNRIGINPLTWSNDDLPSLGQDISLNTCLSQASAAGYSGIELGHKFPRSADALEARLAEHGLALISGWHSLNLLENPPRAEWNRVQPHLDLLERLGCSVVICAEVTDCIHPHRNARQSSRRRLRSDDLKRLAEGLSALAESMHERGHQLVYHHHMGTVIQSESEVDALMDATTRDVGLLLDTGHMKFAGGDPVAVAHKHADRIAHLHCKDIRSDVLRQVRNEDTSFLEAVLRGVFTVPGDGDIDFDSVYAPLRAAGYDGWLVVEAEQDPAIADPVTYATRGFDTLSRLIAKG